MLGLAPSALGPTVGLGTYASTQILVPHCGGRFITWYEGALITASQAAVPARDTTYVIFPLDSEFGVDGVDALLPWTIHQRRLG